ncbi:MAG: hypothetical protein ABJF04_15915 [Reichenbachiella sp.]|uniref:hypothetical protein n=1 Tax=Reichenbachiella sp. TaxID=2184521 RepID=UPI0032636C6E
MKTIKKLPLTMIIALGIIGCGCQNKKNNIADEKKEVPSNVYLEPDTFFKQAIASFENGDMATTYKQIGLAIDFIKKSEVEGDTVHIEMLDFAIEDLTELQSRVLDTLVSDIEDLKDLFSKTDISLALYHIDIVSDWVGDEINNERSLRRMHKALVRAEYALAHKKITLNDEEKLELIKTKSDVVNADQPSLPLWESVKIKLEQLNDKIEENTSSLDEDSFE